MPPNLKFMVELVGLVRTFNRAMNTTGYTPDVIAGMTTQDLDNLILAVTVINNG